MKIRRCLGGWRCIPALTFGLILSTVLTWWGRRLGGSLTLQWEPRAVLELCGSTEPIDWLDMRSPDRYGAAILEDPTNNRRVLLLTQRAETTMVIDRSAAPLSASWQKRTHQVDSSALPISSESAGAVEVAKKHSITELLAGLESSSAPLMLRIPLPSGSGCCSMRRGSS